MAIFSLNLSVCSDISKKKVVILFIFGVVIRYHALLMPVNTFGSVPNVSNMATFSYILCICYDISEKNGMILFIFVWYSNQVLCVADACKIAFGSMPNLSNYRIFFLNSMSLL